MGFVIVVKGREYHLAEGETSVGRDPASALVLDGRGVSRRHVKLVLKDGKLLIIDQGSTYGTRVNGAVVSRKELNSGDKITIGMHRLNVKDLPAPGASGPGHDAGFLEDVTEAPAPDVHHRKTLEFNQKAIQIILDNPDEDGRAVKILSKADSSLMKAVKRLEASQGIKPQEDSPDQGEDYRALLLMYKVSERLVAANSLKEFMEPVADLVLDVVQADTVVLLLLDDEGTLIPSVIRHRGKLVEGEIPISRSIVDRALQDKTAVISNDPYDDNQLKPGESVLLYNIKAVMALPLMVKGGVKGVLFLSRSLDKPFVSADGDLVSALASLIASGIRTAQLRERFAREKEQRKALERFHPPSVVDQLAKMKDGEISLEEHVATVLVCEIEGFNDLVGRVEPRKLTTVLHEYYELLYDMIFSNGGSLVKLHEGWALALFGTPRSPNRDTAWAVEAARGICSEFASLSVLWPESKSLLLHCALDTGPVIAGVVGPIDRLEYTALGLPISTATKLAKIGDETSIHLTRRTLDDLPGKRYNVEELPSIDGATIYKLLGA